MGAINFILLLGFAKIAFGDLIAAVPRLKLWLALL
jgi:hypothetical protein